MLIEKGKYFYEFLEEYNQAFYNKNINLLKRFYDSDINVVIDLEKKERQDTNELKLHQEVIAKFFSNKNATKIGGTEPLMLEDFTVFNQENAICCCFTARYKSMPSPGVKTTMFLEGEEFALNIMHVHCSFEAEK